MLTTSRRRKTNFNCISSLEEKAGQNTRILIDITFIADQTGAAELARQIE